MNGAAMCLAKSKEPEIERVPEQPEPPPEFTTENPWKWKTQCRPRTKPEKQEPFEWTPAAAMCLATHSCSDCSGLGLCVSDRNGAALRPCNCVLRHIFRICLGRYRDCVRKDYHVSRVRLDAGRGKLGRNCWSMRNQEFVADFCLVSRRFLNDEEYALFKYHYLLGKEWRFCSQRLGIDRGRFFHAAYRIQQKLGRAFAELRPYALHPLMEYFS